MRFCKCDTDKAPAELHEGVEALPTIAFVKGAMPPLKVIEGYSEGQIMALIEEHA